MLPLQFQNIFKETYLAIIDENKKPILWKPSGTGDTTPLFSTVVVKKDSDKITSPGSCELLKGGQTNHHQRHGRRTN
jgi:hypothetical protein